MWRWLLEKLPKRFGVLGTLWLISGTVHGVILLTALLIGGITDSRQALVVSGARRQTDARMVLLPMLKTVRGTQFDQPVRGTKFAGAATKKPASQLKKAIKSVPKKQIKPVAKKLSGTTLASASNDKKSAKKIEKKIKPVPKPPKQKLVAAPPAKKLEEKKTLEKESVLAKNELQENKQEVEEKPLEVAGDPNATQDVIYVGRDDLREMQTQNVVADALQKHWQSPSGIAKDTVCQVSFDIDADGKAINIVMKQNSKVLIFDIAARTAILQAHFNPAAQGKQFTVAFKP